jgi:hypothetical protein
MKTACLTIDKFMYVLRLVYACQQWKGGDHTHCQIVYPEGRAICTCHCHSEDDRRRAFEALHQRSATFRVGWH